jgi:hypothetical protein
MRSLMSERHAAFSGIVAMVLLAIGNFVSGTPPKFNASPASIHAFYADHHRAILIGMILTGLASVCFVWFAMHLVAHVRAAGQAGLGAVLAAGAIVVVAVASIGDALNVALAQMARGGTADGTLKSLYQLSFMTYGRFFWFALLIALPVAVAARRHALPAYLSLIGLVQCVLFVLGGISLRSHGFFAAGGTMVTIAFTGFLVGTAVTAWALWQEEMHSSHARQGHHHPSPTPA